MSATSIPSALPCVHGHRLTEEQLLAGLSAMRGTFALNAVYEALLKAGVPVSGPYRRGSWGTNTAYAAAIEVKKIAVKAGFIRRAGYHSWRSNTRLASAIDAATAGETTKIGSTEGESAGPKDDAQERSA